MSIFTNQTRSLLRLPLDHLEERRLNRRLEGWHHPEHVGIILDGNRRFARSSGASNVLFGHSRGAEKLYEVLRWFYETRVNTVTIWIFSLDNFHREAEEVQGLFDLIESKTRELTDHPDVHKHEVRVRFIGRTQLLPERLRTAIDAAEAATSHYTKKSLNVAIAYGGREEITDATRRYLEAHSNNGTSIADLASSLDVETLKPYLYTADLPDPDLIIRTSGEIRLSGFLLWQSAYSEYYFCERYWPQFRKLDFLRALEAYHKRQRRYGR